MNVERWVQIPEEFPARLRWAGRLLAAGLLIELPTLFWPHTVSFFLFLGGRRSAGRGRDGALSLFRSDS